MITELQTLEGLEDAHRGAGYSCQLGNAEEGIGILSKLSSISLLLHREGPQSKKHPILSIGQGHYRKWQAPLTV